MKHYTLLYIALFSSLLLTACKDTDDLAGGGMGVTEGNVIHVGGVNTDELVATASVTRTDEETVTKTDAENISWLVEPLENGLDITYGLSSDRDNTSRVAILKLLTENGEIGGDIKYSVDGSNKYAEYSFLYRHNTSGVATNEPAIWYGNGAHFFEGLYVPDEIEYNASANPAQTIDNVATTALNLTTDQHDDGTTTGSLGNYTLLSRYLGMPSNYTISATVARIKLPFRHRLARVLAYILIDPDMGTGITLNGYKSTEAETTADKDDPTTTDIRFCNVKVLQGVKASASLQHYTYTPQWKEQRKVIPHFVGERGSYNDKTNTVEDADNFIAYYSTDEKTYTYPDDDNWNVLKTYTYDETTGLTSDGKYKKVTYGKVPVYDLIVRPTYTSLANVMYDEEGVSDSQIRQDLYALTNQIDFELTLSNGLQYEKRFTFDLNANYQTVVYLHISKERVDYNSSGSELWVETKRDDDYYGVNNQNGNTLSIAGSSWQRAYTNADPHFTDKVTDGHYYKQDGEDLYAQYVDDATWIEMLREACVGGKHHGDYFILDRNISIPAAAFPENFVFTGHLDGQDHTITLTNASYTPATDTYVTWTTGGGFKYVESGSSYVKFEADANTTYYQKDGETYTAIENFKVDVYEGSTVYTKGENITYDLVSNAWTLNEGTYYDKDGNALGDISSYLNNFNGNIYTRTTNPDSYTAVTNPTTENPHDQGWYEKVDETTYNLTEDTEVQSGKTYYTKDAVSYTYTAIENVTTLIQDGDYYKKTGDETYESINNLDKHFGVYKKVVTDVYTAINFFKKVHTPGTAGAATSATNLYMFSGLNGNYTTAQEENENNTWEANVHKETRYHKYWVPFKTGVDGWRAEVINLNVNGGSLFKSDVIYVPTTGATVTGYVHNCWLNSTYSNGKWSGGTKVTEYTPAIPVYNE